MLLLQIQFLPFHDEFITWTHRAMLVADIVLLWALWPAVLSSRSRIRWPRLALAKTTEAARIFVAAAASICAVWFSCLVATFPGEWQEDALAFLKLVPVFDENEDGKKAFAWTSFHDLIFSASVDPISLQRTGFYSNNLVLAGFNVYEAQKIDEPKKVEWREHLIDLRGRDLRGAVFPKANLTKANLLGAKLQGASLDGAELQGASFYGAQLQGASLNRASIQGASLESAQLQGASFVSAQLQGASFRLAHLQGASFSSAQLQAALLTDAQLQGALLDNAQFQGAVLDNAQLQGASLNRANLQGASLVGAQLQNASLNLAFVWKAETQPGKSPSETPSRDQSKSPAFTLKDARVVGVSTGPCPSGDPGNACTFEEVKKLIEKTVPQGNVRDQVLTRIEKQLDSRDPLQESRIARAWSEFGRASPTSDVFEKGLANQLRAIGCAPDGAPYVIRGLLARIESFERGPALAGYFLDQRVATCARARYQSNKVVRQFKRASLMGHFRRQFRHTGQLRPETRPCRRSTKRYALAW